jgi:hypothetical protein
MTTMASGATTVTGNSACRGVLSLLVLVSAVGTAAADAQSDYVDLLFSTTLSLGPAPPCGRSGVTCSLGTVTYV